jgi:hypothetical protein
MAAAGQPRILPLGAMSDLLDLLTLKIERHIQLLHQLGQFAHTRVLRAEPGALQPSPRLGS